MNLILFTRSTVASHTIKDIRQLGEVIRTTRKKQKITQEALATFAGLHRNSVARIERGEVDAQLTTLIKITELLKLSVILQSEVNE